MNKLGASSMVISLLTGPLLVTLMGARAVADALTQAGIASEEFFFAASASLTSQTCRRLPMSKLTKPIVNKRSDP